MDTSHTALAELVLRYKGFDYYRCDRDISVGMNLGNMTKMLEFAEDDDFITIDRDDDIDSVSFIFDNPAGDKHSHFKIKPINTGSEHLRIPEVATYTTVRMPSYEFARICKDLYNIGDTVVISVIKESVKFSTSGDIGDVDVCVHQSSTEDEPEDATVIEMYEPVSNTFPLGSLKAFTKATLLSDQVTISLTSTLPVVVEYKIANMGYLRFYLAPDEEEGSKSSSS